MTMKVMAVRNIKSRMIMDAEWMISGEPAQFLDHERSYYMLMASKVKFDKEIEAGILNNMYEIIFHYFNLNSLMSDGVMFSPKYERISNVSNINDFFSGLKKNADGPTRIIQKANEIYADILRKYMSIALRTYGMISVFTKNSNIHKQNSIYLIMNIASCDVYEIWQINYNTEVDLGSAVKCIKNISVSKNDISAYTEFVKSYNDSKKKKNADQQITENNTIGISVEQATDTKNVVFILRDTIMLNKLFNYQNPVNTKILHDINDVLVKQNTFPYKIAAS